jgi:periplasmic copper chaperone A
MTISNLRRALLRAVLFTVPFVAVVAAAGDTSGVDVKASDAWARATAPGAGVAAVYLVIQGGAREDRLVNVKTARAAMAQVHSVTTEAGVSRMREMTDGVVIPARGTVTFAPQGLHIMLMGLQAPLVAGESFTVTLEFAAAGKREVEVQVQPATATGPVPR